MARDPAIQNTAAMTAARPKPRFTITPSAGGVLVSRSALWMLRQIQLSTAATKSSATAGGENARYPERLHHKTSLWYTGSSGSAYPRPTLPASTTITALKPTTM